MLEDRHLVLCTGGKAGAYISTSMLTNPNHVGRLYLTVKKQKVKVCSCFGLAFSCFQYISTAAKGAESSAVDTERVG